MGSQSLTHPPRRTRAPLRTVLLLLLSLVSAANAQTGISATTIPLLLPSAIVYDPTGNLYIAETANHVIRKVDTNGNITIIAGTGTQGFSGDNGPATAATLDSPQGLALDTANNLYLADTHNHRIRKLNLTTGLITTIAGAGTSGFSGDNGPATTAYLNLPTALALDTSNNLYLADTGNHRIRKVTPTGTITTIAGTGTQGFSGDNGPAIAATIDTPIGLAADTSGNLYLADTHNHRIRRIAATTGLITTIAGTGSPGYSGDNAPATSSTLALPHGLTLDASGNIYLADTSNNRIRRIDATTGLITTIAGTGTQTFSGDNGPAIAATLDTPRATTVSPASLVTLADTGNQRIRQLQTQTATIQTIAGLGITVPATLTLTSPSTIAYGTGDIVATLSTSTSATGLITFLETTNSTPTPLGTALLVSSAETLNTSAAPTSTTATFNTAALSAGLHSIIATYAGDPTHPPAQSSAITLSITPQPLTAIIAPITLLYGQPIPAITGTVTGILPQDASSLTATFTTSAVNLSPTGTYPLTAAITGPAAGNYALTTTPASLTITPAASLTTLSTAIATATTGTSIPVATHVASTTTGTPTGFIVLLDNSTPLLTTAVSPTGDAAFNLTTLASGPHTLTAFYSGDANFTSSISTAASITIGTGTTIGPDFTLASTGTATQTISSGTSTSFNFSIQMQGTIPSPITLAATGLPNLATASFNPAYLPPGGPTTFTLTIATPNTTAPTTNGQRRAPSTTWAILLFPLGLILRSRNRRRVASLLAIAILSIALTLCSGCGDRVDLSSTAVTASTQTYSITVTGTATTAAGAILQHSATVILNLQSAN